jgi:hypothetical protein
MSNQDRGPGTYDPAPSPVDPGIYESSSKPAVAASPPATEPASPPNKSWQIVSSTIGTAKIMFSAIPTAPMHEPVIPDQAEKVNAILAPIRQAIDAEVAGTAEARLLPKLQAETNALRQRLAEIKATPSTGTDPADSILQADEQRRREAVLQTRIDQLSREQETARAALAARRDEIKNRHRIALGARYLDAKQAALAKLEAAIGEAVEGTLLLAAAADAL